MHFTRFDKNLKPFAENSRRLIVFPKVLIDGRGPVAETRLLGVVDFAVVDHHNLRRELRELQQRLGLTTIFVTHDQEEANAICDRIAIMKDGVVQQVGAPMELYEKPANLFVAHFLGAANILSGVFEGSGSSRRFARPTFRTRASTPWLLNPRRLITARCCGRRGGE